MPRAKRWKCEVCGYIHEGDDPPDACPICGVGPEMFTPYEDTATPTAGEPVERWQCTICNEVFEGEEPPSTCPVCGADQSMFEPLAPPPTAAKLTTSRRSIAPNEPWMVCAVRKVRSRASMRVVLKIRFS